VRLPEFIRTTTFRWTLVVSGAFALCILLMFGFVYWQTAAYMTGRVDNTIARDADAMARDAPERWREEIDERLRQDPRRIRLAGLFGADGTPIAGNLESLPDQLVVDSAPQTVSVVRIDNRGREAQTVRAIARQLRTGAIKTAASATTARQGSFIVVPPSLSSRADRLLAIGCVETLAKGQAQFDWRMRRTDRMAWLGKTGFESRLSETEFSPVFHAWGRLCQATASGWRRH
jgi:hypothetical protein